MKTDMTNTPTDPKTSATEPHKRSILHRRYIRALRRESHGIAG